MISTVTIGGCAHIVGYVTPSCAGAFVVRCEKYQERKAAMRNTKKLKSTGIINVNKDLCPASLEIKEQISLLKKVKDEEKTTFFQTYKLGDKGEN